MSISMPPPIAMNTPAASSRGPVLTGDPQLDGASAAFARLEVRVNHLEQAVQGHSQGIGTLQSESTQKDATMLSRMSGMDVVITQIQQEVINQKSEQQRMSTTIF